MPIGWDEAVDRIARNWKRIIADHGAEAILPYSYAGTMGLVQRNAGHPFFHRMGASRLDRTICSPAKSAGWAAVMGDTPALPPDTLLRSDLVLIWGSNAMATNLHGLQLVREARRRGAKVWLIDTYETATATACDRVALVRPGSDGALALGLMHLLVRDGRHDPAFLAAHTQGFPELAGQVLPAHTPERTAELTGLSAAQVEELAEAYGRARAPFILLGSGLSRYGNGAMNVRAIACLPAVAGAWARDGGGAFSQRERRRRIRPDPGDPRGLPARAGAHGQHEPPGRGPGAPCAGRGSCPSTSTIPTRRRWPRTRTRCCAAWPGERPVHGGARALPHRHRPLRRHRAAGHLLPGAQRPVPVVRQLRDPAGPTGHPARGREPLQLGRVPAAGPRTMGYDEPFFRQDADALVDQLLDRPSPATGRPGPGRLRPGPAGGPAPRRGRRLADPLRPDRAAQPGPGPRPCPSTGPATRTAIPCPSPS